LFGKLIPHGRKCVFVRTRQNRRNQQRRMHSLPSVSWALSRPRPRPP
jgi:hypothetical protein